MVEFPRKADGRRVFSVAFKRETVARITSGEKTLAELSRELGISPSVVRNWMRLVERGGTTAVAAGEPDPLRDQDAGFVRLPAHAPARQS